MKTLFYTLAFFITVSLWAQDTETTVTNSPLRVGIDLGANFSRIGLKSVPTDLPFITTGFDRATRAGVSSGLVLDYELNEAVTLSSGLRFEVKGGNFKQKNDDFVLVNTTVGGATSEEDVFNYVRYRLNYFEIPVLVKVSLSKLFNPDNFDRMNNVRFLIGTGAQFNVTSDLRYNEYSSNGGDVDEDWTNIALDGGKGFVANFQVGLEYNINKAQVYLKYTGVLGDVYDTSVGGFEDFGTGMGTISTGFLVWVN